MSALDIDAKPIRLETFLESVAGGSSVLPAFQRDFDWSDADIVSLVATVLCGWPAGSLLLMDGKPSFFDVRPFEDGPRASENVRWVVLDGQQRLTALYRAFYGAGDRVFFVALDALVGRDMSAEDLEETISVVPQAVWRKDYGLDRQARDGIVPLSVLKSPSDFFAWRDLVLKHSTDQARETLSTRLYESYGAYFSKINSYSFPAVVLDSDLPPSAVARIFERINRSGLRLSTFDLLVARVYDPQWNMRERWDVARRENEGIAEWFADDGLPIVQAISLVSAEDVRQPAMLRLPESVIREKWDAAVDAMVAAIDFVRGLGVIDPAWMPYRGLILPLAGRALELRQSSLDDPSGVLEAWFWSRSFSLAYDVGSSTRISADYRLLARDEVVLTGDDGYVNVSLLVQSTRKQQSALWATFLAALSNNRALDLLTGRELQSDPGAVVPVSLFGRDPDAILPVHLRIFGLVLLSRESAKEMRRDRGRFLRSINSEALGSQFLWEGFELDLSDPEAFLERRVSHVRDVFERRTGLSAVRWLDQVR